MESESPGGGTLLVLEPKSLRSFTTNDEYLYAMKEDLADWFSCLYKLHVDAETFLSALETGVILCRHANEVQHFFRERRFGQGNSNNNSSNNNSSISTHPIAMRSYFIRSVPEGTVTWRNDVKPGTFQARDNVSNFISWCRSLGIPDVLRFETDDLVLRKNEKSVILCLLELARVGAKLGMPAPTLVQMEQEIDHEIESGEPPPQIKTCDLKSLDELVRELVGQCSCPVQFPLVKVGEGKYQVGESKTLVFVRVLRNHVMVRVGGGWDTLENYLNKHDPCRCHYRGHRAATTAGSRHHVIRRSSTTGLLATRVPNSPTPGTAASIPTSAQPSSPRRMSAVNPPPAPVVSGASPPSLAKSASPGPGVSRGASPARSASPTPFSKAASPARCSSPILIPATNGLRRVPPASAAGLSIGEGREPQARSSSAGGRQSAELQRSLEQHQQQQQSQTPQHQAVQRCKSPSPTPTITAAAGRSIPRPVPRGASGIPRPLSPSTNTSGPGARRQLFTAVPRSVSFDIPCKSDIADDVEGVSDKQMAYRLHQQGSSSMDQHLGVGQGGADSLPSIDQISTMTLAEFKKLISSSLTVPAPSSEGSGDAGSVEGPEDCVGQQAGQGMRRSNSADPTEGSLSWSSVRDKAKSVCNSLASSASSRRPASNATATVAPGMNVTRTPHKASITADIRPKTPSSGVERPVTPLVAGTDRSKTPSSLFKPKNPIVSAFAYNSKPPKASEEGWEKKQGSHLSRPKTAQRSTTPGSVALSDFSNPRVQTTAIISKADEPLPLTNSTRVKTSSFVYSEETEIASEINRVEMNSVGHMMKSASWTSNHDTSSVSLSLAMSGQSGSLDNCLDEDSAEIAEATLNRGASLSLRDRPATPSRIPKPSFIPRLSTPVSSVESVSKPASSTPNRPSAERELVVSSSDGVSEQRRPAVASLVPRCATPSACTTSKSYTELYQTRRAQTPGPGNCISAAKPTMQRPTALGLGDKAQHDMSSRPSEGGQLRKARSVTSLLQESVRLSSISCSNSESADNMYITAEQGINKKVLGRPSTESQGLLNHQESYNVSENDVQFSSKNCKTALGSLVKCNQSQPRGIIRKPNTNHSKVGTQSVGGRVFSRTEAWVDSTLNDPKCKPLPPRSGRRAMTPNSLSLPETELMSRPLEEIQAALPSPAENLLTPDADTIETLPEDPEMYRKMEQLFEKYREMELRASVCETPGGDKRPNSFSGGHYRNSQASFSSSSAQTGPSVPHSGSYTSGFSARGNVSESGSSYRGSRGPSMESDHLPNSRLSKEGSPAAAASLTVHYSNGAASNMMGVDSHRLDSDEASVSVTFRQVSHHHPGAPAVSAEDIIDSVEALTISADPTALVSKIKEMLAVRPRNEDAGTISKASGIRSRIPAPASKLDKSRKISRSASNLLNGDNNPPFSTYPSGNNDVRDESTNSDVSSDFNSRCETPVPKVTQPLTTGRSTLFKRELSGRSQSQDGRVSPSSSFSSSSHRHQGDDSDYM